MSRFRAGLVSGFWVLLLLVAVFGVVLNVPVVNAVTTVSGHITQDTTWVVMESPYRATSDVTVDSGVQLAIEPGVEVQFDDGYSLVVEGSLNATGTETNPIIFTSSSTSPSEGIWSTITFEGSANESFRLEHGIIQYATNGITIASLGAAIIENNDISNNSQCGIMLIGQSNAYIKENTIKNNEKGIATSGYGAHSGITITGNAILSNKNMGICLYSEGVGYADLYNVTISHNDVSNNGDAGIALESSASSSAYGGYAESYVYNINISSNTVSSNQGMGISMHSVGWSYRSAPEVWLGSGYSYAHNVTIRLNTVTSNNNGGISVVSGGDGIGYGEGKGYLYDVSVSSNFATLNGGNGISLCGYGLGDYGYGCGYGYVYDVSVSYNQVSSNIADGIIVWAGESYCACSYLYQSEVCHNIATLNGGNGIRLGSSEGGEIYNVTVSSNVASSNRGNGIDLYSLGYARIYDVIVSSNTVLANEGDGMSISAHGLERYSDADIYNITISSNKILENLQNGIYLYSLGYQWGDPEGNIYGVVLSNNTISSNNENGVYSEALYHNSELIYDLVLHENTISANRQKGIWINGGINANLTLNSICYNMFGVFYTKTTNNSANNNDIYRNSYGMNVTSDATVNAEYDYWGDLSGPFHAPLNPDGKGNPVNGNGTDLDFMPFLTDPVGQINERPLASLSTDKTVAATNETVTLDGSTSTDDNQIELYFFDYGDGTNSRWTASPTVIHKYASAGVYNATLIVMDNLGVTSLDGNLTFVTITVMDSTPPTTVHEYDCLWHTADFTIILTATDDFSGVAETYYRINDDPTKTVSTDGQPLVTTEGADNKLEYWSVDNAGNEELPHKVLTGIKLDKTAPFGSIIINNGDAYTTSTSVTLTLTASDATSGVYQMRFSNDGTIWTDWEAYTPSKSWTLPPGDGTKTVYYQIKDIAELVSITYLDIIVLDTTSPSGSITINDGAAYTTTTTVTLTLSATDETSGIGEMRFSNDNTAYTEWEAYATSRSWTLQDGDGAKTVYVQFRDHAGLISTYSDTITLDTIRPTGSITIAEGAAYTNSSVVTLTLSATDATSGVAQMRFSNDNVTWSGWEPYATSKSWTLLTGDGLKGVTVQYKDNAGLISSYSDSIILDTKKPSANAGNDQTVNEDTLVTFDASASTDENGIATYTWTFTDTTPQTLTGKNPTYTFATPGTYTITLKATDPAGNTATDTVIITVLDITKPIANAGSDRTVNEDTQITLDGSASSDNVAITTYTWTFTDVTIKTLTGQKPTYTFNTPGVYTMTLNVTDAAGNWATDTVVITVLDITKPVANAGSDKTINVGTAVTFDAGGSTDNVGIVSYEWNFGDGTTGTGIKATHTYASQGTYTATLTVKDSAGNTATDSITITVHAAEGIPMWIIGAAIAAVALATAAATLILWKRRK